MCKVQFYQSVSLMGGLTDSSYSVNTYAGIHQADISSGNHLILQAKLLSFKMTL